MSEFIIQPQFGSMDNSKSVKAILKDLPNTDGVRIKFENATNLTTAFIDGNKEYLEIPSGIKYYETKVDLGIPEHSSHAAISVFASIEIKKNNEYVLEEIVSSVFFLTDNSQKFDGAISIDSSFIGPEDTSYIDIVSVPNSKVILSINDKHFSILTDAGGEGSISVRCLDISDNSFVSVVQKFPIYILTDKDNYTKKLATGAYIHCLPEKIAMHASCSPEAPDPICLDVALQIPPPTPTDMVMPTDNFVQLPFGIPVYSEKEDCEDQPLGPDDAVVSVQDYDTAMLANGEVLVAFTGRSVDESIDPYTGQPGLGRIFFNTGKTSLKERVFRTNFGTIPPNKFNNVVLVVDDIYFDLAEVGYRIIINHPSFQGMVFTIQEKLEPDSTIAAPRFVLDQVVITQEWIICTPYIMMEAPGCLPKTDFPASIIREPGDHAQLPPLIDASGKELPIARVAIDVKKDITSADDLTFVYVVAEGITKKGSQLFFGAFEIAAGSTCKIPTFSGSNPIFGWHQLTNAGENKNPQIVTDKVGNVHIFWESDRSGLTQIYYGLLGPSALSLGNSTLSSSVDKQAQLLARKDKPKQYVSRPIMTLEKPSAPSILKDRLNIPLLGDPYSPYSAYDANSVWFKYEDENNTSIVDVPDNSTVRISGNPIKGQGMAFTIVDEDVRGFPFTNEYNQRTFAINFDLVTNIPIEVLTDQDIDLLWEDFKQPYTAIRDSSRKNSNIYELDGNKMILGKANRYYDRIIPIAGSYKNLELQSLLDAGLFATTNKFSSIINGLDENLRHVMLGLMPEKIKFTSTNTQTLNEYCETLGSSPVDCIDLYKNDEELVIPTGRYKLFAIMNGKTDYIGYVGDNNFALVRQIGEPFSLNGNGINIGIAQHYRKMNQEDLDNWLGFKNGPDNPRYLTSINIALNESVVMSESFLTDMTDQHIPFEIALGFPATGQFTTKDILEGYETMVYDNVDVDFTFKNIVIGAPNVKFSKDVVLPLWTRYANQMTSGGNTNELEPESFETKVGFLDMGVEFLGFSQIPLTFEGVNKSPQIDIGFTLNDIHLVWESNRELRWDVYYSEGTDKSLPFRYDTKVTDTDKDSLMPDVGIDINQNRLISWHEKEGDVYQVYAAKSLIGKDFDEDEARRLTESLNPDCFDPPESCVINFNFCNDCPYYYENFTFNNICSTLDWCDPQWGRGGVCGVATGCNLVLRPRQSGGEVIGGNSINCSKLVIYRCAEPGGGTYRFNNEFKAVIETAWGGVNNTRLDASDGPFVFEDDGLLSQTIDSSFNSSLVPLTQSQLDALEREQATANVLLDEVPFWNEECQLGGYAPSDTWWSPTAAQAQAIFNCIGSGSFTGPLAEQHTLILHVQFWRKQGQTDEQSRVKLIKASAYNCLIFDGTGGSPPGSGWGPTSGAGGV